MAQYKLTYFDIDGGRGEPIRLALHIAGIEFEDHRISFDQFGEMRSNTPFNAVPVVEIDGAQVTQSNAICRFIGKKAGLYPEDDLQALYCDEALEALEDMTHYIVQTFGLEGDALKQARQQLVDGRLTTYLRGLDRLLVRGGGQYFADDRLTIADLRAFVQTRALCSGMLDHVPAELVQQVAPSLADHQEHIAADPRVAEYYAGRP